MRSFLSLHVRLKSEVTFLGVFPSHYIRFQIQITVGGWGWGLGMEGVGGRYISVYSVLESNYIQHERGFFVCFFSSS